MVEEPVVVEGRKKKKHDDVDDEEFGQIGNPGPINYYFPSISC